MYRREVGVNVGPQGGSTGKGGKGGLKDIDLCDIWHELGLLIFY